MVKAKLNEKVKQDPISVVIVVLVIVSLMFGLLLYMHADERQAIRELRHDLQQEIELREVK